MIGLGRAELAAAVGSPPVVVSLVLGQDRPEVPFAEDEHPVGELGPGGEYEPFRVSVRARAAGRDLHGLDAGRGEDCVQGRGELPGPAVVAGHSVCILLAPHRYAHARSYTEAKWANLAPVSRRSVAEALVTVTIALTAKEPGGPDPMVLRQALFSWAFNPATRETIPPPQIAAALDWAERASLPVTDLEDTATVRLALGACATTLAGKPAAGSTQRRKRSVFYNALGYAVELGRLGSNPVDRIQWTAPAVAASVDRRVVVSPAQAGTLLAAVGRLGERGEHLKAFFAGLYYAALRPSEAVMLRQADLHLPKTGVGTDRPFGLGIAGRARPGPMRAPPARNAA